MKKSKAKLLVGSLALSALLLAGTVIPVSCTEATSNSEQNEPNPSNPGGGSGNQQQTSKYAASNEALNVPGNAKATGLYNQYIDALGSDEIIDESQNPDFFADVGQAPQIKYPTVATKAAAFVNQRDFLGQVIDMLASGLENPEPANPAISLEALITQLRDAIAADETLDQSSVWSKHFYLSRSIGTDPEDKTWEYTKDGKTYTLYFPSDNLNLTYDDNGMPVIENKQIADGQTPAITDAEKIRLTYSDSAQTDPQNNPTIFFFKPGVVQLPPKLLEQFPAYYSEVIDNAQQFQSAAKSIIDAYKRDIELKKNGIHWWNQTVVENDQSNSGYIKEDLASADGSKIFQWIRDNAKFNQDLTVVPTNLNGSPTVTFSPYYSAYYGLGEPTLVFSATDTTANKEYDFYIDIVDFTFNAQIGNFFDANQLTVLNVAPRILLGEGSKLIVSDSDTVSQPTAEPVEVALRTNDFIDATSLIDEFNFSYFWDRLVTDDSGARQNNHEIIDLLMQSDTTDDKLSLWSKYMSDLSDVFQPSILDSQKQALADFVADNID